MSPKREKRARATDAILAEVPSPIVEHYDPLFIGEGGAQSVFELKGKEGEHRKTITKVHRMTIVNTIEKNLRRNKPLDFISPEDDVAFSRRLSSERAGQRRLKKYFGEAVLAERLSVARIPITNDLLKNLSLPREKTLMLPEGIHDVVTILTVQERMPKEAFSRDNAFDMRNEYLERSKYDADRYAALNAACIDRPDMNECRDALPFVAWDVEVFERAETDVALRSVLIDFFRAAIRMTSETGDILDCIGEHNVRCYRDKSGTWKMLLVDARTAPNVYGIAQEALRAFSLGHAVSSGEQSALINVLSYVRYMNAAAGTLGMTERLHLSPTPIARMSPAILRLLHTMISEGTPQQKT